MEEAYRARRTMQGSRARYEESVMHRKREYAILLSRRREIRSNIAKRGTVLFVRIRVNVARPAAHTRPVQALGDSELGN